MKSEKVKRYWLHKDGMFLKKPKLKTSFIHKDFEWTVDMLDVYMVPRPKEIAEWAYHLIGNDAKNCQLFEGTFLREGPDSKYDASFYFPVYAFWSTTSTGKKLYLTPMGYQTYTPTFFPTKKPFIKSFIPTTWVTETHYYRCIDKKDISSRMLEFKQLFPNENVDIGSFDLPKRTRQQSATELAIRLHKNGKYDYKYFLLSDKTISSDQELQQAFKSYEIGRKNYKFTKKAIAFNNPEEAILAKLALDLEESLVIDIQNMEVLS